MPPPPPHPPPSTPKICPPIEFKTMCFRQPSVALCIYFERYDRCISQLSPNRRKRLRRRDLSPQSSGRNAFDETAPWLGRRLGKKQRLE
ncbi:hypothetical protein EVAR_98249_1 [Eumeta japonica]|uniref:Uncharacterized protein n=1 Tax=Eumeta variegata TaxID=151549 RepID=A0A4C1Y3R3_EUMVA|nr:hypothetical protein EVAR_98249_1 [Eumeta japonica]